MARESKTSIGNLRDFEQRVAAIQEKHGGQRRAAVPKYEIGKWFCPDCQVEIVYQGTAFVHG